jgi:hypothetical protein
MLKDFVGWFRFHADWIPLLLVLTTATGQLVLALAPLLLAITADFLYP